MSPFRGWPDHLTLLTIFANSLVVHSVYIHQYVLAGKWTCDLGLAIGDAGVQLVLSAHSVFSQSSAESTWKKVKLVRNLDRAWERKRQNQLDKSSRDSPRIWGYGHIMLTDRLSIQSAISQLKERKKEKCFLAEKPLTLTLHYEPNMKQGRICAFSLCLSIKH